MAVRPVYDGAGILRWCAYIVCVGAPLPHVLDERAHPFLAAKLVVNIGQPVRESAAWIELVLQQNKDIFLDQEVDTN